MRVARWSRPASAGDSSSPVTICSSGVLSTIAAADTRASTAPDAMRPALWSFRIRLLAIAPAWPDNCAVEGAPRRFATGGAATDGGGGVGPPAGTECRFSALRPHSNSSVMRTKANINRPL